MKIAIVSDLHIGYERFAEDAIKQAREALEKASEVADAILLPGDIFDKRSPKPDVIAQVFNIFRELSKKEWKARVTSFIGKNTKAYTSIPVVAISGTHERTAEGKDNPLNLLALAGLLVDTSEATTIIEKDDEKVAIFGLGGISDERVKEKIVELNPKPVAGAFSIFMLHQSIYELLPFSNSFIHYDDLPKNFDLYINGHIHSYVEALVHGKKFLISGSTVLTQLKEGEQGQKGFIVFNTKEYSHEFKRINSRPLISKTIHFEDVTPNEISKRCEAEIEQIIAANKIKPVIRLSLEGTIKEGFNNSDLTLHALVMRYSHKAVLSVDNSKLVSPEFTLSLEGVRESRIDNMPIKERGMHLLLQSLAQQKFDSSIDVSELFSILSSQSNKEKVIKQALEELG